MFNTCAQYFPPAHTTLLLVPSCHYSNTSLLIPHTIPNFTTNYFLPHFFFLQLRVSCVTAKEYALTMPVYKVLTICAERCSMERAFLLQYGSQGPAVLHGITAALLSLASENCRPETMVSRHHQHISCMCLFMPMFLPRHQI